MKKMLVLIIIFILTFSFDAFALEYKIVNISTTFAEDIEFSDIEKVKLTFFGEGIDYVDDASSILNIIELTKDNNYSQTINNIKIVDQSNLFAIVDKDNYGLYNCELSLDTSVIDTANINIHISKNTLTKNEYTTIPSDILEKIIGTDVVNNNGENQNNNNDGNNSNNDFKDDNEIIVGTTKNATTTIYKEELKKRQEQEEKEKTNKKNNIISIALFSILGIILFIVLLFVVYKFVTANK